MAKQMTVKEASVKVIAALRKSGYHGVEVLDVFCGLYRGEAWREFDLVKAVVKEYHKP